LGFCDGRVFILQLLLALETFGLLGLSDGVIGSSVGMGSERFQSLIEGNAVGAGTGTVVFVGR
jgi:hypothetical protein